ncbi:MAG TPA: hypothetical protein VJG67_01840 [Candidatus Paceibacterota bacterium]
METPAGVLGEEEVWSSAHNLTSPEVSATVDGFPTGTSAVAEVPQDLLIPSLFWHKPLSLLSVIQNTP